jgi:hypothetical protein
MLARVLVVLSLASAVAAGPQRAHTSEPAPAAVVVLADQSQPRQPAVRLPLQSHGKDPFAKVLPAPRFVTPSVAVVGDAPVRRQQPERVLCGMRLFSTDPALDRQMVHTPQGHEPAVRRLHPTVCVEPGR